MLTKEDLEKMGIIHLGMKIYPNRFFVPQVGEVDLYPPYRWEDIFDKVYDRGYAAGVREGERRKSREIKKALGIDDSEE